MTANMVRITASTICGGLIAGTAEKKKKKKRVGEILAAIFRRCANKAQGLTDLCGTEESMTRKNRGCFQTNNFIRPTLEIY